MSHTNVALYNSGGNARIVPSALITVCNASDPQVPCTTKVSLYTDPGLSTSLANPFNADANGNYTFYVAAGNYTVTVTGAGVIGYSYQISLLGGAGVGTANVWTQSQTFSAAMNANNGGALNGTFTGPTTLTGQNSIKLFNLNNILYVDGSHFATLAAALAVCPATGCTILDSFPETFAADPFASITAPFEVHFIGGPASATWVTNVGLRLGHNGQKVYGSGPNLTEIQANSGTFPTTTAVISVGAPGPSGVNGSGVFDLAIDCASVAGCIGIHLDGAQELSGTSNTQVVNAMGAGFEVSSAQGAGADQNRMVLDHIRSACSVSAAITCVPVLIASTAGARVVIRDVTAVTVTPTTTTDCIRDDSNNATVMLSDAHVEECTNGFHHTSSGGQFEVDGLTGMSTVTTLVTNDNAAASYIVRQLILNSATNTLVDTGRSITTTSPFCMAMGVATSYVSCVDRAIPYQFPSSLRITPPIGGGPAVQLQLLSTFTGSTPAFYVLDDSAHVQFNITNDGRWQFRGGQTGAFVTTVATDTLTAGRALQTPNGPSTSVMVASLVTTAATTDAVAVQGMTASGHCSLTATNAAAAAATTPSVTTKGANTITVTHAVTANMNYDIMCTSN